MVELLAPAGNFISLMAAVKNGADSVYIGLKDYNMRANANNFSIEDIKKAALISKEYSSKLYIGLNTLMKNNDIEFIVKKLPIIKEYGAHGIILSDIGLIETVVENDLEAHISVQENTSNIYSLKALSKLGAKRAILSRELSLSEIKEIATNSPIETEIFIHGAMCMAISGRCFLSYGLYGRSANCGDCLQPCRKEWKLIPSENNPFNNNDINGFSDNNESFIISKSFDNSYKTNFFSPKDMALIEHIPELIDSGVDSFKIEGRARSPDYVATATRVYREAIDSYNYTLDNNSKYKYNPQWMDDLKKVFNRGFDTGFYFNQPYEISEYNKSKYIKKDIAKVVNYYSKIKVAELKIWDDLSIGDEIMIQGVTTGSITHKIESMQINGKNIKKAEKGINVAIAIDEKVRTNDFVYKLTKRDNF